MKNHGWHLHPNTVPFSFLESQVQNEEKIDLAKRILQIMSEQSSQVTSGAQLGQYERGEGRLLLKSNPPRKFFEIPLLNVAFSGHPKAKYLRMIASRKFFEIALLNGAFAGQQKAKY